MQRGRRGNQIKFEQHSAQAHRACVIIELLVTDFIASCLWPRNSTHLNPVEYTTWRLLHQQSV